jgi:AraC-like DNA-binding protein
MQWAEKINDAIDYIENHLNDKIDYSEAARISCCSINKFQRLFLFLTDMSISEYVRRRRMSEAAWDLRDSDIKIIDLALKYDYDSPEAFTRAFQSFHGVPPSITRKLNIFKKYDRISIQVKIHSGDFKIGINERRIKMKKIIENVCEIGWGQTSANPYIGAVTACMDALNESNDFRLAYVISGLGFAYTWFPCPPPGAPNDANIVDDDMIKRTFDALGYNISIYRDRDVHQSPPSISKDFYKEKIISSIDNGLPVMGFGFTENYPYACAILGYEDNGEKLYLRSYWNSGVIIDEQTGYQCTQEWYQRCYGIVVIEEKISTAITGKELLKHCMNAAVAVTEKDSITFYDINQPYGFAAYDAMIGVLEDDGFWEKKDASFYNGMDSSYCHLGLLLCDHYKYNASTWLRENVDDNEIGSLINKGCDYYNMLGWLITEMLRYKPDFHDTKLVIDSSQLALRDVREGKVPLIKIVKQLDQLAVECFKKALKLM